MENTRVFLVDSLSLVLLGLRKLVEGIEGVEVCGEAEDAETALAQLENSQPDLCIMDIRLADKNAFDLLENIPRCAPGCRILVSSMRDEVVFADKTIRAGAHGFVSKNEPESVIVSAIRKVIAGDIFVSEKVQRSMFEKIHLSPSKNSFSFQIGGLSEREFEVFEMIGMGRVSKEIASDLSISAKTVEAHRQNIRNKLGLRNMSELICCAAVWNSGA